MHDLRTLLGATGTAATGTLIGSTSARSVARWLDTGRLVRLHPGWVTVPELAEDWTVRAHAATGYTGGALSHMSALAVHGLVDTEVTRLDGWCGEIAGSGLLAGCASTAPTRPRTS